MAEQQMRRKDRQISEQEALALLDKAEYGFLGLVSPDGEPYAVPLSFVMIDGQVYFHCARQGYKNDCIAAQPKGCFTVVGATKPVFANSFTTYYESAMLFGTLREVEDADEKYKALYAMSAKYLPENLDQAVDAIRHSFGRTAVFALKPEKVTGKAKKSKPDAMPGTMPGAMPGSVPGSVPGSAPQQG